jgi:8-oxo-dGTP pyrophosphatase MutT (NUDIX family)
MQLTHVVTCFLLDPGGRLLILRRGSKVGTYQGRWAGVSGYLETDPEEQAYTELSEEVGLSRQDLTLLAQGEPLEVVDTELGRTWVVHPLLFRVNAPDKIRLDWEHTESRWIDPAEIASFPTVPGLVDALKRVYP